MKKGLLHETKINLLSPHHQRDIDQFVAEVRERMEKHAITHFVMAKKQEGDVVHMVILPCSNSPADQAAQSQELKNLGFETTETSNINEMHQYAQTDINPVSVEFKFGE